MMKNKLTGIAVGASLIIGGGAIVIDNLAVAPDAQIMSVSQKIDSLPQKDKLKASTTDILGKLNIDSSVVKYAYKTKLVQPLNASEKLFINSRAKKVSIKDEDISKRTPKARIFTTNKPDIYVAEIIAGDPQYYQDPNGDWYNVDYATTTIDAFNLQISQGRRMQFFTERLIKTITKTAFAACASPCTVYPDPDAETTTIDGYVGRTPTPAEDFATIRSGAGNAVNDTIYFLDNRLSAGTISGTYVELERVIYLYDTSVIGSGNTVTAATLSEYGFIKNDAFSSAVNIYSSNPASNVSLASSDYSNTGTTAFCDTPITTASWTNGAYNNFTLNSTGIAAINVSGITKLSRRFTMDASNSAPTWVSGADTYVFSYSADQTGTSQDPKLVVTYTASAPSAQPSVVSQQIISWW